MSAAATEELAETREITRQRRTLEVAVSDRGDDVADQQRVIAGLAATLANVGDEDAETRVSAARARLRNLHAVLEQAQTELDKFSQSHPTLEQLRRQEELLVREIDDQNRLVVQQRFARNMTQRLEMIAQLHNLEIEASLIFEDAKRRWPVTGASDISRPAHAGINQALTSFIPPAFFPYPSSPGLAANEGYLPHRRAAEAWIERWKLTPQ